MEDNYYPGYNSNKFNDILNKYEFQEKDKHKFVYQDPRQLVLRNMISKNTIYDSMLLYHMTGSGKCHAKDAQILMFDGTIKKVQDIKLGELLMGDDSTPRTILSLAQGTDKMYDIIPVKGESYTVNQEHIICLKVSGYPAFNTDNNNNNYNIQWVENNTFHSKTFTFSKSNKYIKEQEARLFLKTINFEQIIEISVKDYLNLSKGKKRILKGYRVGVDFPNQILDFDPYMIGFWLGDGSQRDPVISCQDSSVLNYFRKNITKYDLTLNYHSGYDYRICGYSGKVGSNKFLNILKKYDLINNKHIPHIYKCNSRENRLKLLAGLLDSDGSLTKDKSGYEFTQSLEHEQIIDDIIYLARSLGFACYKNIKDTTWTYKGVKNYGEAWRINISGKGIEEIPVLCPRKKANARRQVKDVLNTGITVKYIEENDYYGFTLDGNSRYIMGDFTVTHNTCSSITIAEGFKEYVLNMGRRILVLVKNGNIEKNFKNELLSACGDNEYISDVQSEFLKTSNDQVSKKELMNKITRKINKVYNFMTYGTFVNQVLGMKEFEKDSFGRNTTKQKIKDGVYSRKRPNNPILDVNNTVIIIDEAHNITNNDVYIALMSILEKSYNYRLLLLTATPMYDNPKEIIEISNLLNANNVKNILPIRNELFKSIDGQAPLMKKQNSNYLGE